MMDPNLYYRDFSGNEYEQLGYDGTELGFGFGNIFKAVKKAATGAVKITKSVVRSPITKAVAGGVAVAFPAVGVPTLAALAVADRVVAAAEQGEDVVKKAQAVGIIKRTTAAAKKGDADAARAVHAMRQVAKAKPETRARLRAQASQAIAPVAAKAVVRSVATKPKPAPKAAPTPAAKKPTASQLRAQGAAASRGAARASSRVVRLPRHAVTRAGRVARVA